MFEWGRESKGVIMSAGIPSTDLYAGGCSRGASSVGVKCAEARVVRGSLQSHRARMSCRGVMSTSGVNFKPNSSSSRFLASFPWLISCGFKGRLPSHPYKI
jgi:hypothetical protein